MKVNIGTSGFSYHHWSEKFYPEEIDQKDWLSYYSGFFNSVELNVSFYRLPEKKTFENWREQTPENFVFAVKGSRYITHTKRLLVEKKSVDLFMERAKVLGGKLSVILWQLPPSMKKDTERLSRFLKLLKPHKVRFAFEFRERTWFSEEIYKILKNYNVALVVADSPDFPKMEIKTADFSYLRFHRGKYLYSSDYSEKEMKEWSRNIKKLAQEGDVYAYFNNDANAFAVKNALDIKRLTSNHDVQK